MANKSRTGIPGAFRIGGVWYIRTDPVTGRKLSSKLRDTQAFKSWYSGRQRLAADPRSQAAATTTCEYWSRRVLKAKIDTRSSETVSFYTRKFTQVLRVLGRDRPIGEVNPDLIDDFIARRTAEGVSRVTIGHDLTAIVQMCKMARRGGAFAGDVDGLKPVGFSTEYVPHTRWLTRSEVEKLRARMPARKFAWVAFAICTGARKSEVDRYREGDFDPERRLIQLRGTKTKKSYGMMPAIDAVFGDLLDVALQGLPYAWPRASKELPQWCAKVGIAAASPNDLRRTFGSWLKQAGVGEEAIRDLMRHTTAQTTRLVYTQDDAEALRGRVFANVPNSAYTEQEGKREVDSGQGELSNDSATVALRGVEPRRPFGQKILNPKAEQQQRASVRENAHLRSVAIGNQGQSRLVGRLNTSQVLALPLALSELLLRRVA